MCIWVIGCLPNSLLMLKLRDIKELGSITNAEIETLAIIATVGWEDKIPHWEPACPKEIGQSMHYPLARRISSLISLIHAPWATSVSPTALLLRPITRDLALFPRLICLCFISRFSFCNTWTKTLSSFVKSRISHF